jgi:hypothetical protein
MGKRGGLSGNTTWAMDRRRGMPAGSMNPVKTGFFTAESGSLTDRRSDPVSAVFTKNMSGSIDPVRCQPDTVIAVQKNPLVFRFFLLCVVHIDSP